MSFKMGFIQVCLISGSTLEGQVLLSLGHCSLCLDLCSVLGRVSKNEGSRPQLRWRRSQRQGSLRDRALLDCGRWAWLLSWAKDISRQRLHYLNNRGYLLFHLMIYWTLNCKLNFQFRWTGALFLLLCSRIWCIYQPFLHLKLRGRFGEGSRRLLWQLLCDCWIWKVVESHFCTRAGPKSLAYYRCRHLLKIGRQRTISSHKFLACDLHTWTWISSSLWGLYLKWFYLLSPNSEYENWTNLMLRLFLDDLQMFESVFVFPCPTNAQYLCEFLSPNNCRRVCSNQQTLRGHRPRHNHGALTPASWKPTRCKRSCWGPRPDYWSRSNPPGSDSNHLEVMEHPKLYREFLQFVESSYVVKWCFHSQLSQKMDYSQKLVYFENQNYIDFEYHSDNKRDSPCYSSE